MKLADARVAYPSNWGGRTQSIMRSSAASVPVTASSSAAMKPSVMQKSLLYLRFGHFLPAAEAMGNLTVVTHIDETLQTVL